MPQYRHPNNWTRGFRRDIQTIARADVRASGLALCDAMVAWQDGRGPRPSRGLIADALRLNSRALTPAAAIALALLLEDEPDAQQAIEAVFDNAPALARAQLVQFVQWPQCVPNRVLAGLTERALEDRSRLVRTAAVYLAERLRLRRVLPRLIALREQAGPGDLADHIGYAIANIEHGYYAKRESDGKQWHIVLATKDGRSYFYVSDSEVRKHGLKGAIRREVRASRPPSDRRRRA
jgi:hypothetical protein